MRIRWFIPTLMIAVSTAAFAQRPGPPPPRFQGRPSGFRSGFNHPGRLPVLYPFPFYDAMGWDYPAASTATAQPQVIVVQQPASSQAAEPAPTPAQPLMIELRGDRYVQVSGSPESQSQTLHLPDVAATPLKRVHGDSPVVANLHDTQPAFLVFRDGHREEISSYTIANGVLYAKADYYTAGAWNRAIQLSSLNLPETIQSNQSKGVPFRLPGAPNEVMVGP